MAAFDGKNVLFLQGTQTKLNELMANGGAKEGAFYLTNDTHRLYIGRTINSVTKPVAVNEGVMTVANVAALASVSANAGEFYYAQNENILCIYNGQKFIQINSDANTVNTKLQSSIETHKVNNEDVEAIRLTLTDSDNDIVYTHLRVTDSANAAVISHDVEVIGTVGEGADAITLYGTVIDIKSDIYTLGAGNVTDGASITLTSANDTENAGGSVSIVGGDHVTVSQAGDVITIAAEDADTVITDVKLEALTGNDLGKLKITIEDSVHSGTSAWSDTTGVLGYTNGKTGNELVTYKLGDTLPSYTKDEVDKKLRDLNGMTYKTTTSTIPTIASNGDMWMVNSETALTISAGQSATGTAVIASKGDLIIAQGTEDDNGVITTATLKFAVIPAGDDTEIDTTYKWTADADNHKLSVNIDETNGDLVGGIDLDAGTAITLTSVKDTDGKFLTTTIAHADLYTDTTLPSVQKTGTALSGQATVTAVTAVEINKQGHVTKVETTNIGIQDTTYTLSGTTVAEKDANKSVIVTDTLTGTDGDPSYSKFLVKSETLKVNAVAGTGTGASAIPAGFAVEMVWGSFN